MFCSQVVVHMNKTSNTRSEAVRPSTEHEAQTEVSTQRGPSVVTITLIVNDTVDMNKTYNTSSEAVSPSTEHEDQTEVSTQRGGPSVVTITLIVNGTVDMNKTSNTSSEAVSPITDRNDESEVHVSTQSVGPSVVMITLIVTGVLLVCAIGGGLILAKVVKRARKRQKPPEYCDVYDNRTSQISLHSYAEIVEESSCVIEQNYAYAYGDRRTSHSSVNSYADVGSDSSNAT